MRYIRTFEDFEYKSVGFESILNPINEYPYNEDEIEIKSKNPNIRIYKEKSYNDYRFVYYINGESVSAIHFTDCLNSTVQLQELYTKEEYRRMGYAKILYLESSSFFKKKSLRMIISKNLSELGKLFFNSF